MKPILVTSYVNPDLDGTAGVVAYAEFLEKTGGQATAAILGEPHDEAKYVLERFGIEWPQQIDDVTDFERIALIDASNLYSLDGKVPPEKVITIIDHRKAHETEKFPNASAQIELVGAAATLVAEKFFEKNIEISPRSATLICGAIISNTLNFKGNLTTERDRQVFERLKAIAKLPDDFWKDLFAAKSDLTGNKLLKRIESETIWFEAGGKKVCIAQIEMIGARKLVGERNSEITQILESIKTREGYNLIFQNIIDLEELKNFFITIDEEMKKLLENILGIRFAETIAESSRLIMRKEIVPLLKEKLEKL